MIKVIRHKGLKALFERNQTRGVNQNHVRCLRAILARLDAAAKPSDMDFPGLRLHSLRGRLRKYYAVDVSDNWRVVFRFDENDNVTDVDLTDYH